MLALKLTNSPVSVVVFIGLIMLVGIVVKNAIVLIDRVNQLREEGVTKLEAIAQGAESRLRPIVDDDAVHADRLLAARDRRRRRRRSARADGDHRHRRSAVSTLLTLVVIPVVYDLLDRRSDAWYVANAASAIANERHARPAAR